MAHITPPPPRRVLGDIGDLVTPPPRTRRRVLGELSADVTPTRRRVLGELDAGLTPSPLALHNRGTSQVFRFTLKSRLACADGEIPISGCESLSQPARRIAVDMPRAIQICRCSQDLKPPPKKRLCGRNTDEHDEYMLLKTMSSKGGFDGSTAGRASLQELEVHFIVIPENMVIGYVALSSQRPKALLELYAEPEHRQTGAVEMALQFLLGDEEQIVISEGLQEIINRNYGQLLQNMNLVRTDENRF